MKKKTVFQSGRMAIVISMALIFSAYSCKTLQNLASKYAPDIKLVDVNLGAIDFTGANVDFKYEMKNNTALSMTFTRLAFDLMVDGKRFFNADNKKNVQLASNGTTNFTISHRVVYTEFAQSLLDLYKKDKIKLNLDGKVGLLVPAVNQPVEVPITAEKVVPMPKLPSVKFKKFQYVSFSPLKAQAKFALKFNVKNNNAFGMDLSSIDYNFDAAGSKIINDSTGAMKLSSGSEKELSLPVTLRGTELIKLVPKLRDLSNQKYSFNGAMNMKVLNQTVAIPYNFSN